ncbi:MAG: hypothetical protein J3Q66DRAFT_392737 [Benniella sp.]|nr:MAG: hypothetical protein J3Q66DRAFT_392737 [Benniella sp.]
MESLIDVASFTVAFKKARTVVASDLNTSTATATREATPSSRSTRLTNRLRNNGSGGSGGSTSSNLTPAQIIAMRTMFNDNFTKFRGEPWLLSSGAIFDECVRDVVHHLPLENALLSFILKDMDMIFQLFENATDQEDIKRVMCGSAGLPTLSPAETAFLRKYNMPPNDLDKFLSTHGWRTVGEDLQDRPLDEFQSRTRLRYPLWLDNDTETVITVISRVLILRKAILALAASVITWTSLKIDGQNLGGHDDCIAPTMTSPQFLPTAPVHPDETIDPLNL